MTDINYSKIKEFKIGGKNIFLFLKNMPYYEDKDTIIMGFPYNLKGADINEKNIFSIKGYYTCLKISDKALTVINDIFGNYRMYYMCKDNNIFISDDFLTLYNILNINERIPDYFNIRYWQKHRYFTGEGSCIKCIKKFKPAHITTFSASEIQEKLYFKNVENCPNRKQLFNDILCDLRDTVSCLKKIPLTKVLLFSGGTDSTLIVKLLQEQDIDFIPVFIRFNPLNSMNYDDLLKANYAANILGIKIKEIVIDNSKKLPNDIIDIMFTDRAMAKMLFFAIEKIRQEFGENIIILNGQASDSIFNFGPTDTTFGDYISRQLMFDYKSWQNRLLLYILHSFRTRYKNNKLPKTEEEFLLSFFDNNAYKCLIDSSNSKEFNKQCLDIIKTYSLPLSSKFSLLMYLKIFGFLQGSDNYMPVQACEYNKIKTIFLFATPNIIYSVTKNTDYKFEILHPKSVIYDILKKVYNYKMPNVKKEPNYKDQILKQLPIRQFEEESYYVYYDKFRTLEFAEKVEI